MVFGPESSNLRERRAYAHAMIDGHRRGAVPYEAARLAVEGAVHSQKGQRSGFRSALDSAAVSPVNVERYGAVFAADAVMYRAEPFKLRAGGESHWYVDARQGLSKGAVLAEGARLMIAHANNAGVERAIVAGMGIAGSALATAVMMKDPGVEAAWGNDKHATDERYGYGLHGAKVTDKRVWVVDDTATTGDSLVTLIGMVREEGGIVEQAAVLTDRSKGRAQEALSELGVGFQTLLVFDEQSGAMKPSPALLR